jgi:hypothetical protein
MNAYQIAVNHKKNWPESRFFDSKRLDAAREGLDSMRVLNLPCIIRTEAGSFACFQVCSTVRGSNPREHRYHYFDIIDFNWIATKENKND